MAADEHDRGLAYDLRTLIARRRVLGLFAGAGLAALIGCADDTGTGTNPASSPSGSPSSTSPAASPTTSASGTAGGPTEEIPAETAGPFPGDGSNGPNVLTQSGIVRGDIRSSFGSATGVADGGEALQEALVRALHRAGGDVRGRVEPMLVGDVLGDRADVHVRVGEAGHQCLALQVERRDPSGQRADPTARRHLLDAVVLDDDRRPLDGIGPRAVDQERVGEDRDAHFATTLASYIHIFSSARGVHSTVLATP